MKYSITVSKIVDFSRTASYFWKIFNEHVTDFCIYFILYIKLIFWFTNTRLPINVIKFMKYFGSI